MTADKSVADLLLIALGAGILGAAAMEFVMWLISRAGWAQGNMIIAIGSLITRSRTNAFRTGIILHAISAVGFALLYTFIMEMIGVARFPTAIFVGAGFGVLHGIVVSLALVWVVAEEHPLEEFNEAGLAVGVSHLAGHVAYGAAVGLVIALSGL